MRKFISCEAKRPEASLLAAALVAVALVAATTPAFAQRTATYPEGSVFTAPAAQAPAVPQQARLSPLDPLDQPGSENAWKPSNRDAGNLAEQRWEAYDAQRAAPANAAR
jgi:hypothetical protein